MKNMEKFIVFLIWVYKINLLHRPKRKMRQNVVMIYIFYNYVSNNLLNVLL
jgi:hypothetical protein